MPCRMSAQASGFDLPAALTHPYTLEPQKSIRIATGFALAIPPGYEAQVRPRSGLAYRYGITILNAPGTIDADYRGEIAVLLINFGEKPHTIQRGDRIAQLVIQSVPRVEWEETKNLSPTKRGAGGFGHTGIRG